MVMNDLLSEARRTRESESVVTFNQRMEKAEIRTLKDLHQWLFSSHQAYASGRLLKVSPHCYYYYYYYYYHFHHHHYECCCLVTTSSNSF